MSDLDAFDDGKQEFEGYQRAETIVDLVVFSLGDRRFAIRAREVDSIIPWVEPSPLPRSAERVLGVVQDRGRLVVVFAQEPKDVHPSRLIVCTSSRGLVGLGATETHAVGPVRIHAASIEDDRPVDSEAGVLTLVRPDDLVKRARERH